MPRCRKSIEFRRPAAGYTLLELLLVAGLLAAAAAIIVPNILSMPTSYRLRRAGDDVRAMLVGIRARAMDDGVPYEFSFDMNASTYRIRKIDSAGQAPAEETSEAPVWMDVDPGSRREFDKGDRIFGTHQLEEGVTFRASSGESSPNSSSQGSGQTQNQKSNSGSKDASTIRFEPTGMATSFEFQLEDAAFGKMRITVRGLTGAVTMARVDAAAGKDPKNDSKSNSSNAGQNR